MTNSGDSQASDSATAADIAKLAVVLAAILIILWVARQWVGAAPPVLNFGPYDAVSYTHLAEQLHFALDASEGQGAKEWAELYNDREQRRQLEKLVALIQELAGDYLVKRRASWRELRPILKEHVPGSATLRVGLQDEIYRIYAEHMGLFADPVSEETELIRRHAQTTKERCV